MIQKKICMLGSFAVGKSSLVRRFVENMFSEKYMTTIGVKIEKKIIDLKNQSLTLVIWDIAGENGFHQIQGTYLRGMSGYILVADKTRTSTLDIAINIHKTVGQAFREAMYPLTHVIIYDKITLEVIDMQKYTTKNFDKDFPTDDACLDYLFKDRYPDGVFCVKCGKVTGHYRIEKRACYSCEYCGSHVYPMAGTIFQDTRFDHLRLWFKAIAYMSVTRCGISSRQLSRDLGVTVKTGYRMWKQIRKIFNEGNGVKFVGKVEIDETYIGGKAKGKRGRGALNKTVVLGVVERKGRAKGIVIPDVKAKTLIPVVEDNVVKESIVYTDDLPSYNSLDKAGYDHKTVAHSQKVYVSVGDIHTNNVEGFWSQLKRSINGTYHHVTAKHMQEYVDEYSFRFNHRNDETPMFLTMLKAVVRHSV